MKRGLLNATALAGFVGIGIGGWAAAPALAQTDPAPVTGAPVTDLPPVTATALRSVRSLFETPANVTTINRPEIERRQYQTIEDLVRYEPGVFVTRQTSGTDPAGSLGGFTIRGVGQNRVLTMVDGARTLERITDNTRDVVDLGHMKRVEIVRGPASVLWGSDALGGVVAFTTKDPEDYLQPGFWDFAVQADMTYNSFNRAFTEIVTGAARVGPFEFLLSYTRRDAREGTLSRARNSGGDWPCTRAPESLACNKLNPLDIESNSVLGKVVYRVDNNQFFKLTTEYFVRYTKIDQLWDHGRGSSLAALPYTQNYERHQDLERFRVALEHNWQINLAILDSVRWQITYHPQQLLRTGERYQLTSAGPTYRYDSLRQNENFFEGDLQFKTSFDLGPSGHQLTYGFYGSLAKTEYERWDTLRNLDTGVVTATSSGFNFANTDTTRLDGYIQDEIAFFDRRLLLTPGLRFSTYRIKPKSWAGYATTPGREPTEIYETDLSKKIGVVFKVTPNIALYGQYSEGFKMPTAEQLFTSSPGVSFRLVPNPDLQPERVKSFEVGVRGQFRDVFVSTNFFHARYKNFIQSLVNVPGTVDYTSINLAKVNFWGFEGSGAWRFHPNFELNGAFMWQVADQKEDPQADTSPFNGAEPFRVVAGLRWKKPEWGLDLEFVGQYFGGVTRTDDTPTVKFRPGNAVVFDFSANWSPRPWIIFRASLLNMFDKRYYPAAAATYDRSPSSVAVAATNPLELQTAPGRTFRLGLTVKF